ncbi:MAG: DUF5357 family protein [Cyanobacteria bacterium P01_A01_bin.135]
MPKIPTTADMVNQVASAANTSRKHFWQTVRPDQSFSWQTLLFLCLFSWLMALLTSDSSVMQTDPSLNTWGQLSLRTSPAKYALFTMGWIFLSLAVAWLLHGSKMKVPLFDIVLRPAAWVTAAIVCAFLFQVWQLNNLRPALIAWPIVSALFYIFPRCYSLRKGYYVLPKVSERQHLLIVALASLLVSCWLQFYFVVQDWVEGYRPTFVDLVGGTNTAITPAEVQVANLAESVVASQLEPLPIPEIRRGLQTNPILIDEMNDQFDQALTRAGNSPDWALQIEQINPSPLSFRLNVLPPFTGVPDTANGDRTQSTLYRTCQVTPLDNVSGSQLAQVTCSDATRSPQ